MDQTLSGRRGMKDFSGCTVIQNGFQDFGTTGCWGAAKKSRKHHWQVKESKGVKGHLPYTVTEQLGKDDAYPGRM